MSAPQGVVLAAAAVVGSPVAWMLYQGTITLDDALVKIVVCVAFCWIALSVVGGLTWSPPTPPSGPAPVAEPVAHEPSEPVS